MPLVQPKEPKSNPIEETGTATIADPIISRSNGFQPPSTFARPIISTLNTWDEYTKVEYPFSMPSTGRRPAWNVPNIAVTNESVNTIRSSVSTRNATASNATASAKAGTGRVNATMQIPAASDPRPFKPVAQMVQVIRPLASVQISFSLLIQTPVASSPRFVIYRDGQRLSQEIQQATQPNLRSLVSGSYIDYSPPQNQNHSYQLYCRPTDAAVTFSR